MKPLLRPLKFKAQICISIFIFAIGFAGKLNAQTNTESTENNEEATSPKSKSKTKKNTFDYNNIISIYPFQAAINYMTIGYEFRLGEKTALKTIAGIAQKEENFLGVNATTNYSAYRLEMQLKYFITKKSKVFNGMYVAPFGLYKSCKFSYEDELRVYDPLIGYYRTEYITKKDKASATHIGFLIGYHAKMGESFTMDLFAGEGIMSASGNKQYGSRIFDMYANEIRMRIGMCIGYGF